MWKSVLSVPVVSIDDNFFELGGNSLLVMRLFSELEAALSCRLPLTEIFAAPTVEQLAPRLEQVLSDTTQQLSEQSTLSPLRIGPETAPPLFLVHDADGDTGLYLHLANRLPTARTVYAIRPRVRSQVRDGAEELAYSEMGAIAADYVEQMREVQPVGPYFVGGLCAGGLVAFEIALQLEQLGEKVFLTMMDAPAPKAEKRSGRIADERMARLSQSLEQKQSLPELMQKLLKKGTNVLRYEVTSRIQKVTTTAKGHAVVWWQRKGWTLPRLLEGLTVRDSLVFAYEQYRPTRIFNGSLLLVRATEGDGSVADIPYVVEYADSLLGWTPFCTQSIQTFDAPGGHSTMLRDENVSGIAEAMEGGISDAIAHFSQDPSETTSAASEATSTKVSKTAAIAP
ncbi:MAG: thioesterase domain-containing protein [Cyanobacteria bacterium J06632_3]